MSVDDASEVSLVGYHLCLPDDFYQWSPEAQRAWLAGGLTQRQMLNYAADNVGLDIHFEDRGPITNRDIARFVVALTERGI